MNGRVLAVGAALLLLLGSVPFFTPVATDAGAQTVPFEQTTRTGFSSSVVQQAQDTPLAIPKAEVFYSNYRYVVGYYGLTALLASQRSAGSRGLGRPLTVYVSDFAGRNASLTSDQFLRASGGDEQWVSASDAYYVVNSSARLPTRERVVVPFSNRPEAKAFASAYSGTVVRWAGLEAVSVGSLGRSRAEWTRVAERRHRSADSVVARRSSLRERPVSVVVGEDAPSLSAAVARAPPNTTVRVPPGTYRASDLRVRKPLTIRGAGPNATRILGDRNGSVVTVSAPGTGLVDLSLGAVGPNRTGAAVPPDTVAVEPGSWLYRMRRVHGYGDAAVVFDTAGRSLVAGVSVTTTSNGIVARDSPGLVVRDLSVVGTKRWEDGFLGVAVIGGRAIVQNSTFRGGKVGVFALDVSDVVVRNSSMEGMMLGVFNLYGLGLQVAHNTIEDTGFGVYVETRSSDTVIRQNTVTRSTRGIIVSGMANYVGDNLVAGNSRGIIVQGHYTLYSHNVVGYNDVAFRSIGLLPTNRVTATDVVGNDVLVTTRDFDVLHAWRANFWATAPGVRVTDGHLKRPFYPTGPVDGTVDRVTVAPTLAFSPALSLLRQLRRTVPGLQANGVLDPVPLASPVDAVAVRRLRATYRQPGRSEDADSWDYEPD